MSVTIIMSKKVSGSCRRDLNVPEDKTVWKLQLVHLKNGRILFKRNKIFIYDYHYDY